MVLIRNTDEVVLSVQLFDFGTKGVRLSAERSTLRTRLAGESTLNRGYRGET